MKSFNESMEKGFPDPGRQFDDRQFREAPYYVVETRPAITYTLGGLAIDAQGRVLAENGEAIEGLLAAGADAGGLYHRAYAGGIAPAGVFGMIAARTALADLAR